MRLLQDTSENPSASPHHVHTHNPTLLAAQNLLSNNEASHKAAREKTETYTIELERKIISMQKELEDQEAGHRSTLSQKENHISDLVKDGYELKDINRTLVKQVDEQKIKIQEQRISLESEEAESMDVELDNRTVSDDKNELQEKIEGQEARIKTLERELWQEKNRKIESKDAQEQLEKIKRQWANLSGLMGGG